MNIFNLFNLFKRAPVQTSMLHIEDFEVAFVSVVADVQDFIEDAQADVQDIEDEIAALEYQRDRLEFDIFRAQELVVQHTPAFPTDGFEELYD